MVTVVLVLLFWLITSLIAKKRNHPSSGNIYLGNFLAFISTIFLGFISLVFWIALVIWALSTPDKDGLDKAPEHKPFQDSKGNEKKTSWDI